MNTKSKVERNNYIDLLKGIAALGIILIHTAFWSGEKYVPYWFRNITLFLDVPFFFYLSGWGASYRKASIKNTLRSLLFIWLKWIFFISVISLVCAMTRNFSVTIEGVRDIRDLINNYLFNASIQGLPVLKSSLWFIPYYYVVIVVNTIVIMNIESRDDEKELRLTYMLFLLGAYVWVVSGKYLFGMDMIYFLFYSFFWMLGLNRFGKFKITKLMVIFLFCIFGFIFMSYIQELSLCDIQKAKFPPSLKYGFGSMFAILIAKFFESKISKYNEILMHIGRNAIWYYFGQGIGSSLLYFIINIIYIENWFYKLLVMFLINVLMTIIISEVFAYCYNKLCKIFASILNIFRKIS